MHLASTGLESMLSEGSVEVMQAKRGKSLWRKILSCQKFGRMYSGAEYQQFQTIDAIGWGLRECERTIGALRVSKKQLRSQQKWSKQHNIQRRMMCILQTIGVRGNGARKQQLQILCAEDDSHQEMGAVIQMKQTGYWDSCSKLMHG